MSDRHSLSLAFFAAGNGDGPRLLLLPALGTPAHVYRKVVDGLADLGCSGAILEWPGTGAHPTRAARGSDWGYRHLLEQHVLPAINAVALADGGSRRPVVLIGHSLGAHLALMARAAGAENLGGIVTIAAGSPYYRVFRFPARIALMYLFNVVRPATALFGYFPGRLLGFAGSEPKTLMREWAHLARMGRLEIDGEDVLTSSEGLRSMPVRSFSLEGDFYAPYESAVHLLACAGLPAANVARLADAEVRGHFDWLRAPRASAQLLFDAARPMVEL